MADLTVIVAVLKNHSEFVAWCTASALSVGAGIATAAQMLFEPTDAWVPFTVLVGLVGVAVGTTTKVVRLLDGIRRDIDDAKKERHRLAKELGLDFNGDD